MTGHIQKFYEKFVLDNPKLILVLEGKSRVISGGQD